MQNDVPQATCLCMTGQIPMQSTVDVIYECAMRLRHGVMRGAMILGLSITAISCESKPVLLKGGGESPEGLIQIALDRLAVSDETGMDSLTITRFEHDSLLIPEMPIGKAPEEMTDLNMAYVMMRRTNMKGLRRAVADYGGRHYEVKKVEFPKPLEVYGPFTVYREILATVRDSAGNELILPIFGSMVSDGTHYKLAAFID
jgi:hypothetical protein